MKVREVKLKYGKTKNFGDTVKTPTDLAKFFRSIMPDNVQEHFCAIFLDSGHQPIGWKVITTGLANFCQVHPRECFQPAIMVGSTAIAFAHNHPSGRTVPSDEDIKITARLKQAGELLGIKVLDHVIVTDSDESFSFMERGYL